MLSLQIALRADQDSRIAFTGAGGKTAGVFGLARDLLSSNLQVFVTSTTHFSRSEVLRGDHHLELAGPSALPKDLPNGLIVFTAGEAADGRVNGVSLDTAAALASRADDLRVPLIVEADGSRRLPAKAPAAHEPVVPEFINTVVVTAGLSVLGQPLGPESVHRPEVFSELSRTAMGEPVSLEGLGAVLAHPQGGRKGIPKGARSTVLLNQADSPLLQSSGSRLADMLLPDYDSALVAALADPAEVFLAREPIAGIVLAGGGSSRMGDVKQLLNWGGKPLVVHAAEKALAAGCRPVVVVTGREGSRVAAAVEHLPVTIVDNPDWSAGQSTSVRAGLDALPPGTGGALFILVDQPYVEPPLLRALMDAHARSLNPIIAPLIDGQRGNPVLFDRETFPDFAEISGDRGGRQLFSRHRTEWVPWHDGRALLDIDTPSDYKNLQPD